MALHYMSLREMSFRTILKHLSRHNILVAAKHTELVNLLWMKPRSAFVEILPPFCIDVYNFHLAQLARIFYISVPDFDYSHSPINKREVNAWISKNVLEEQRYRFEEGRPTPSVFLFVNAIRDSIDYVRRVASMYILNDFWSPIFYFLVC